MPLVMITITTIILQLAVSYLLWFLVVMGFSLGNGWELAVFPLTALIGTWGVGTAVARATGRFRGREALVRLATTLFGTLVGLAVMVLPPEGGFVQILYPLIGAVLGYYFAPNRWF